jgi:molybdopterin biosynthesis enzyme
MQENCDAVPAADGAGLGGVRVRIAPEPGSNIRRRGEDVAAGSTVLRAGRRLDSAAIGLAATVGAARLEIARRPRVALFSTGDELVMPGEPLPPGAIFNSNRFMLGALLRGQGCEVTDLGNVPDRLDATRAMLREAAAGHDLILSSAASPSAKRTISGPRWPRRAASISGRSPSSPASRWRSAPCGARPPLAAARPGSSACPATRSPAS